MESSRGGKIRLYQDLYETYSRLEFTRMEDFPVAISGLEKRLIHAFDTFGGFGVFDDGPSGGLLHRSLVWQRGKDERALRRIDFPPERPLSIPSWSWMAYSGGITYLKLPFSQVDWEAQEIRSPWSRQGGEVLTEDVAAGRQLTARVRSFSLPLTSSDDVEVVFDSPGGSKGAAKNCVILGRQIEARPVEERRHYVLVVVPALAAHAIKGRQPFERVGAGFMPGRFIDLQTPGIRASIG